MKQCPKCGTVVTDEAKFCGGCGVTFTDPITYSAPIPPMANVENTQKRKVTFGQVVLFLALLVADIGMFGVIALGFLKNLL